MTTMDERTTQPRHGGERPAGPRLEPRRLPVGLTLGVAVVFVICCGLGVWQLQRAAWKGGELKRIAALKDAPPQPIGAALSRAAAGADVSFTRVSVDCAPASAVAAYRMTTEGGDWIARARADCRLPAGAPYAGVLVDRGLVAGSRGATVAPTAALPAPRHVEGVLYRTAEGQAGQAPYILVAEREAPAVPGVTPTPYPDAAGNLEYVGAYAPTWFGLAGALIAIYAAMLWRRYHPRR
jgi:surfeit locus 1 family protein